MLILSKSTSPSFNLATEEILFSNRQDDLLFLYVNEPSVILGSNQVLQNEVNVEFCKQNNIRIMRRISGGGAVYHDLGNLNYCFISNIQNSKSALSPDFLFPIISILNTLRIPAEIGKRKDLWLPGGYKISGTASHITKNRELHHGTLLYDADLDNLTKTLSGQSVNLSLRGTPSVPSPVKNIRHFLKEHNLNAPSTDTFFSLFTNSALAFFDCYSVDGLSEEEIEKIGQLQQSKYELTEWIFKK